MSCYGLLIDYKYCSGCHSCEVACRNEKNIGHNKWGIKLTQIGPWKKGLDQWEWDYVPVPTSLCDLCAERVANGEKPSCVHHCLSQAISYGPVEKLAEQVKTMGGKAALFVPH